MKTVPPCNLTIFRSLLIVTIFFRRCLNTGSFYYTYSSKYMHGCCSSWYFLWRQRDAWGASSPSSCYILPNFYESYRYQLTRRLDCFPGQLAIYWVVSAIRQITPCLDWFHVSCRQPIAFNSLGIHFILNYWYFCFTSRWYVPLFIWFSKMRCIW